MDTLDIIIIASSIATVLSVLTSLYISWLKYKIKERDNLREKKQVVLKYKREKSENQLYEIIDSQPIDNLILTGDQELYVTNSSESPKLSTTAIDNSFFQSMGINPSNIAVKDNFACVIMPFNNRYKKIFEAIKKATANAAYDCHRSDETFVTGDILRNIITMLLQSQVIIAVIDGNNPNVFYEIGIAHSIGKPVIFVANRNRMGKESFDVEHNRIILYNNIVELENTLTTFLKKLKKDE